MRWPGFVNRFLLAVPAQREGPGGQVERDAGNRGDHQDDEEEEKCDAAFPVAVGLPRSDLGKPTRALRS